MSQQFVIGCALAVVVSSSALAGLSVNYTQDVGGQNANPLAGLSARGTFTSSGTTLTILLENTSTGVPLDFDASDSLLVSIAFNLPGIVILSGDSAVIGPGSSGISAWSSRGAGDSVAEQWLWANGGGGDLLGAFNQVVSTSSGVQGSGHLDFNGNSADVDGPFGGIASAPSHINIPGSQPAVSNSILFTLTLSSSLTADQLNLLAHSSWVEYGSDQKYLGVPTPAGFAVFGLAALAPRRRRGH
ncbi:MAG: XDD4 family exosortase-dependent surface protein [Phycisphaerales bacterium]